MTDFIKNGMKVGDIVIICKNNEISENICVVIDKNEYCLLEELVLYVYENKDKPKVYKIESNDEFYKFGDIEPKLLENYKLKVGESKKKGDKNIN